MIQNMQTKLNKLWMNLLNIIVGTTVFSPQERRPYVGYYQGQHYQSLEQKQTGLKRKISFANEVNSKNQKKIVRQDKQNNVESSKHASKYTKKNTQVKSKPLLLCDQCDYETVDRSNLKKHINSKH